MTVLQYVYTWLILQSCGRSGPTGTFGNSVPHTNTSRPGSGANHTLGSAFRSTAYDYDGTRKVSGNMRSKHGASVGPGTLSDLIDVQGLSHPTGDVMDRIHALSSQKKENKARFTPHQDCRLSPVLRCTYQGFPTYLRCESIVYQVFKSYTK